MSTISDTANTALGITLLAIKDDDRRRRLWHGYLGQHLPKKVLAKPAPDDTSWPKAWVAPPADGWPQLTDEDSRYLEHIADSCGGHPTYGHDRYMDFRKHTFDETVDFSGLTLVSSSFDAARFEHQVDFSGARFFRLVIRNGRADWDRSDSPLTKGLYDRPGGWMVERQWLEIYGADGDLLGAYTLPDNRANRLVVGMDYLFLWRADGSISVIRDPTATPACRIDEPVIEIPYLDSPDATPRLTLIPESSS